MKDKKTLGNLIIILIAIAITLAIIVLSLIKCSNRKDKDIATMTDATPSDVATLSDAETTQNTTNQIEITTSSAAERRTTITTTEEATTTATTKPTTTSAPTTTSQPTTTSVPTTTSQPITTTEAAPSTESEPTEEPIASNGAVFQLTAYTWTGNPMANGQYPYVGACASNYFALGTVLYIEGYGTYTVCDRGGMASNVIDIYMETYDECIQFGRRSAMVYVIN